MATGTGKTFLTVAQIYRLLESKLARRILFLVDRKALAAQAVREFNAFNTPQGNKFTQEYEVYSQRFQQEDFGDDEPFDPKVLPNEYLTAPKPSHTFVYVSTIQRMARNLFGARRLLRAVRRRRRGRGRTPTSSTFPIHAFDLIIADECHRGYTAQEMSIWRDTHQPLRRHQDRPHRHARRAHHRALRRAGVPLHASSRPSSTATWWTTSRSPSNPKSA